jgi:hypothetical protein
MYLRTLKVDPKVSLTFAYHEGTLGLGSVTCWISGACGAIPIYHVPLRCIAHGRTLAACP